jgi:hypothetical protein
MDALTSFITAHPILAATLSSLWGAMAVDLIAFTKAKEPGDFFGQFSFKVAAWRYAQSSVAGFLGNVAVAGVLGAASAVTAIVIFLW